jgi:hypothetical protein
MFITNKQPTDILTNALYSTVESLLPIYCGPIGVGIEIYEFSVVPFTLSSFVLFPSYNEKNNRMLRVCQIV